ncbi:MAG: polysaccharide deacetylase family protein [Clostridia bacterium]|nr:polysaccharide deacetylase family protein [Clostridia bacterium]
MKGKTTAIVAGLTSIAMALAVCLESTGAAALYFGVQKRSLPIYSVQTEEKKISISFDCAWGTEHTDAILKALADEEVSATWFMVEFWTERYPEYVKKIDEAGHEIGTHSRTHSYMSRLSKEDIEDELKTSSEAITAITGKTVELFRPPYGDYDDLLVDTAKEMGVFSVQWDVDSLDWKDLSAGEIASRIISSAHPGAIILCHNNGLHTADALPVILRTLKNKGYQFVPIGTLIYHSNFMINSNGVQIPVENT